MFRTPRAPPPDFRHFTRELQEQLCIEKLYAALDTIGRLEMKLEIARDMTSKSADDLMLQLVESVNTLKKVVEEAESYATNADIVIALQIAAPAGFDEEFGPDSFAEWLWKAKHELRCLEARHDLAGGSAEALEESVFSETVEERATSSQETSGGSQKTATLDSMQSDAA